MGSSTIEFILIACLISKSIEKITAMVREFLQAIDHIETCTDIVR